jgi:hypothetical protein
MNDLPTFDHFFDMKIEAKMIIWKNNFQDIKKRNIRDNIRKYISKTNRYTIKFNNGIWEVGKKLQLIGGMFVEDFEDNIYEINDEIIDFSFLDNFMFGNDEVMPQFLRVEVQRNENAGEVRFIPNEEIRNRYIEENERLNRDDKRWNEDIVRDNLIVDIEASVTMVLENMAGLSSKANEVAVTNITWNVDEPFVLLSHVFENIRMGWKETLFMAFNDRSLRIAGLKGLIMKSETNNCRMMNLMEAVLDENREGLNMLSQNLGFSISIFNDLNPAWRRCFKG